MTRREYRGSIDKHLLTIDLKKEIDLSAKITSYYVAEKDEEKSVKCQI